MVLPVNVDTTYPDDGSDASVKVHQQHHDTIHAAVNSLPTTYVPTGNVAGLGPSGQFNEETTGTGDGTQNRAIFWRFLIDSDNIAQVPGAHGATGSKVDGIQLEHHYGGTAMQGGRNTFEANSFFDGGASAAGNGDRNYVALQAQWVGSTDDGGTSTANFKGAGFGGGAWGQLIGASANWFDNLTAFEFNTLTAALASGERVRFLAGIQIASENQKRGWQYDAGVALSGLSALHAGFKTGWLVGDMNGGPALAADSTLVQVINHTALTNAFDFSGTTFSGFLLKTGNGFGLAAPAGDHVIEFGRTDGVASSPFIDWHSGAVATDYDSRLQASGGNGTAGHGAMTLLTGSFKVAGQDTGQAPFWVDGPTGGGGDLLHLTVNGTRVYSVNAAGRVQSAAANESTGAGSAVLGANCPAVTLSAPYKWIAAYTGDGSVVYIPAWK